MDFPSPARQSGGAAAGGSLWPRRRGPGGQSRGGGGGRLAPPHHVRSPSTDSIKEGQPDAVTVGKVTRGPARAAREGSDLFPRFIQEPPYEPGRLTRPDNKGKGGWAGGLEVSDGPTRHCPPITGAPQLYPHLPLTIRVARAGPILSSNLPSCSWLSRPSGIFRDGTRGGPGVPGIWPRAP